MFSNCYCKLLKFYFASNTWLPFFGIFVLSRVIRFISHCIFDCLHMQRNKTFNVFNKWQLNLKRITHELGNFAKWGNMPFYCDAVRNMATEKLWFHIELKTGFKIFLQKEILQHSVYYSTTLQISFGLMQLFVRFVLLFLCLPISYLVQVCSRVTAGPS